MELVLAVQYVPVLYYWYYWHSVLLLSLRTAREPRLKPSPLNRILLTEAMYQPVEVLTQAASESTTGGAAPEKGEAKGVFGEDTELNLALN